MGTPFLGELRLMAFNFAPKGWAMSNGQTMSIQQNTALFALLGTFYGGNGVQTFALPNLQGCAPISQGTSPSGTTYQIGQLGGAYTHTLTLSELPTHIHTVKVATSATTDIPPGNVLAGGGANIFNTPSALAAMDPGTIGNTGGSQPHSNQQPYLVMTWCIALTGIFPSRS